MAYPLPTAKPSGGAMQEHCGVNEVCTRQSYDEFGRRVRRWEGADKGNGWGSDASAQVLWSYYTRGFAISNTNLIVEWHALRLAGRPDGRPGFVHQQRHLYAWLSRLWPRAHLQRLHSHPLPVHRAVDDTGLYYMNARPGLKPQADSPSWLKPNCATGASPALVGLG